MEIHEWWTANSREIFWLEITDRRCIGGDLLIPQAAASGREVWGYTLVSHVRPGDVVFHYWKPGWQQPAIEGFSVVSGRPKGTTMNWQPRGTYAQAGAGRRRRPAWTAPLQRHTALATPVTLGTLRVNERKLRRIRDQLRSKVGEPLYFPFALSDLRPVRPAQTYLAKMPEDVVDLLRLPRG